MSEQVQGIVTDINTKTVQIKRGPKAGSDSTVYSMTLDSGHVINLGFKCEFVQGESVNLTVEATNFGDYKIVSKGAATAPQVKQPVTSSAPAPQPSPRTEFPIDKNSRGMSITRQNSGGHAATIVAALIKNGHITSLPEAKDAFFDIAYDITDFATGHREVNQVAAMQAMED